MIILNPVPRRILYVTLFEILAVVFATMLLSMLNEAGAHGNLPVAAASSLAAVVWNFIYNTLFERWERRMAMTRRTIPIRIGHAFGFEFGLVLILIPLFMWWYGVGPLTAIAMEIALLIFFLIYTFLFTLVFDRIFPRTMTAS